MKPKPFCTSNHLHVPVTRSLAPVQKQRRGANMADLPDHIVSAFIIDVDFAASAFLAEDARRGLIPADEFRSEPPLVFL